MENIREIRQQEAVNAFLSTRDFRGITLVAHRVGNMYYIFNPQD